MRFFIHHKLIKVQDGYIVELYLDQELNEFSLEFLRLNRKTTREQENNSLVRNTEEYIKENLPNIKIQAVRIMLGALRIAFIPYNQLSAVLTNHSKP